jgi:hypothetical protein
MRKIIFLMFFFLVSLFIVAPFLIKSYVNSKLSEVSPSIYGHVGYISINILQGNTKIRDLTFTTKKDDKNFLSIESFELSFNLIEFIQGERVLNTTLKDINFYYSEDVKVALKEHISQQKEKKSLPDISLPRVEIENFSFYFEDNLLLSNMGGTFINLIPSEELPKTNFNFQGSLARNGKLRIDGEAFTNQKPIKWTIDQEMLDFDLTTLNKILKEKIPLTFTRGELDLYLEAKSEDGKVVGYVKPFIKRLDVIKKNEDFKGAKHWIIEVITALGNIVVKNDEVSATRVPFVFDVKLKTDKGKAISEAFKHSFGEEISKGIENSISL